MITVGVRRFSSMGLIEKTTQPDIIVFEITGHRCEPSVLYVMKRPKLLWIVLSLELYDVFIPFSYSICFRWSLRIEVMRSRRLLSADSITSRRTQFHDFIPLTIGQITSSRRVKEPACVVDQPDQLHPGTHPDGTELSPSLASSCFSSCSCFVDRRGSDER
jgi:hypothetical protein